MLEKYYEEIRQNINVRENLSLLRGQIKEKEAHTRLLNLVGDGSFLLALLQHEEPKVRKNAALLIGDLGLQEAVGSLFCAYKREATLFVRSSYLNALGRLDASEYLVELKGARDALAAAEVPENERKHRAEELRELEKIITGIEGIRRHTFTGFEKAQDILALAAAEVPENERKHRAEELRELEKIITGIEGIRRHTFTGFEKAQDILLATNKEQRGVTMAEVAELSAEIQRSTALHPLGVLVHTKWVKPFTRLRTYREMLFPLKGRFPADPGQAAAAVCALGLADLLAGCHKEDAPFYFRVELKSRMPLDAKSVYAKRFAAEVERLSGRRLINSTQHYEVELRLVETRDGGFVGFYKLFTIPVKRFSYRKNAIATSIHPATAAMLVRLAKPYLKEDAQILDPFCVGTETCQLHAAL